METTTIQHIFLKPGKQLKLTTVDNECYMVRINPVTYVLTINDAPLRGFLSEYFKQYTKQAPVQASDEFLLRETNTKIVKGF